MSDRRDAALVRAASPGTLAGLHVALKARISRVVAGFPRFETKTSERAPTVVDFTLPPKADGGAEQWPFAAVRFRTGKDSEEGADQDARATFDIEVGTYSDTDDGYLDVLMIIDAIRDDLGAAPELEGTAYAHVGPLTSDVPFPQPRPQWLGLVTTNWILPRPRRVESRNPPQEG